jgi:hypothetical protein
MGRGTMNEPYLLRKHGMYYAHNNAGYVSRALMAEIYTKEHAEKYAKSHDDIQAVPVSHAIKGMGDIEPYLKRIKVMQDFFETNGQRDKV